jgi:predicted alpha/beta superfamily hydrolase
MLNRRRSNAIFFFALAAVGLYTAWYFNSIAVMRGENYITDGFTSNVDWVYSLDLLIGGTAGMAFIVIEGRRLKIRLWWLFIPVAFITAFAFVFPLFLAVREQELAKRELAGGKIKRYVFDEHNVIVWVPGTVTPTTPVLVMNDGHNVFDPKTSTFGATWGILEALQERPVGGPRIQAKQQPLIIGVTYKNNDGKIRAIEYSPTDIVDAHPAMLDNFMDDWSRSGPTGNDYHELIARKILPTIAAEFGIELKRERTAIGGSSMGSLTSMYAMAEHPEVYGTVLGYSTHWVLGGDLLVEEMTRILPAPGSHRIWSDAGTLELDAGYAPHQVRFRQTMAAKGYRLGEDFIETSYPQTGHNELWWAVRVEHPINWWLSAL